jgi:hypothetical protein
MQFAAIAWDCIVSNVRERLVKKFSFSFNHHLLLNQSSFTGDNYLDPTWNIWIHHGKFVMCALGTS